VVKVLDASALGAVPFIEQAADTVRDRLHGASLLAPYLLGHEIANVCHKKIRGNPQQRSAILLQFAAWEEIGVELVEVDYYDLPQLAEQFGLTTYDAGYLWPARHLDAELVTLDRQLARAAAMLGHT
jgi:predicted nucleic acid-binding protein